MQGIGQIVMIVCMLQIGETVVAASNKDLRLDTVPNVHALHRIA